MPEAVSTPEARMVTPPTYIGAVFETGRSRGLIHDWVTGKDIVPVKKIEQDNDRKIWTLENIRVFSDGTLASPELSWKPVIDFWLAELKVAAKNKIKELEEKKAKKEATTENIEELENVKKGAPETELDIKAMMAVSASARAMEVTSGVAAKYVTFMTVDGDLDKQDSWAEFLLHNDSEKLKRVLTPDLVRHYYKRMVIEEVGIKIQGEPEEPKKGETKEEKEAEWLAEGAWEVNEEQARKSKLLGYLSKRNPYLTAPKESDKFKDEMEKEGKEWKRRTSFNEYITDVLLVKDSEEFIKEQLEKGFGDTSRWTAAKLACDTFLVDKYTRWEYELDKRIIEIQKERGEKEEGLQLMPFPGWGGNPLRAVLEPSFLPRRIKKVYQKEDEAILGMVDEAFRPKEEFKKEGIEDKLLPPSMVVHLKDYARYSNALWTFLGSSRGAAIPQWTKKTVEEDLPSIAELLDQVYGKPDIGELIEQPKIGKHIMGAMIARILECKALATAIESARPGFKENMAMLFDIETGRPFLEIERFIWGPLLDARRGLLASLAGGRTRFIFKNNQFKAEKTLRSAWEILSSNDQDPRGRGRAKVLNKIGFVLDAIQAIAAGGKRR